MRCWLSAVFLLITAIVAQAQPAGQRPSGARNNPDFLFGRPHGSVAVRGSWIFSSAGSDWYDFVTDQLTIDHGAFNAPVVTFEVGFFVTPRVDVLAGVDFSSTSTNSEYRNMVDNNRLPITQQTELRGATISGSVKYVTDGTGTRSG